MASDLNRIRDEIDRLDDLIIESIRRRKKAAAEAASFKESIGMPQFDGSREIEIFRKYADGLGGMGRTLASDLLNRNRKVPDSE